MRGRDAFWYDLEAAKRRITERLADRGITRVEYVVGFGEARDDGPWVWLGTGTDEERDLLANDRSITEAVAEIFHAVGRPFRGVVVESQQTVDREYAGSWFYRLR